MTCGGLVTPRTQAAVENLFQKVGIYVLVEPETKIFWRRVVSSGRSGDEEKKGWGVAWDMQGHRTGRDYRLQMGPLQQPVDTEPEERRFR